MKKLENEKVYKRINAKIFLLVWQINKITKKWLDIAKANIINGCEIVNNNDPENEIYILVTKAKATYSEEDNAKIEQFKIDNHIVPINAGATTERVEIKNRGAKIENTDIATLANDILNSMTQDDNAIIRATAHAINSKVRG